MPVEATHTDVQTRSSGSKPDRGWEGQ